MLKELDYRKSLISLHLLKDGDIAIDVGAGHGFFTGMFKEIVGPKGRVFAYEPHPVMFAQLQCRCIGDDQITLIQKAASNETQRKLLLREQKGDTTCTLQQSTVEPTFRCFWKEKEERLPYEVETEKLDDLFLREPLERLKLIKIDVEGHEESVIQGARQLLIARHPFIFFEYSFSPGLFEPKTLEMIQELGYDCIDLSRNRLAPPNNISGFITDFLAVPKGYKDPLLEMILSEHRKKSFSTV